MTVAFDDLWSDDIKVDVRSPFAVLKAQEDGLSRRTQGLLRAEVQTTISETEERHTLDLIAPALNSYRERILLVTHRKDRAYPATVFAEVFAESPDRPDWATPDEDDMKRVAATDEELIGLVRIVLRSSTVRALIHSLLARINDQKRATVSATASAE